MSRTEKFDGLKGRKHGGMLMNGRSWGGVSIIGCGCSESCADTRQQRKMRKQVKAKEKNAVRREVMESLKDTA